MAVVPILPRPPTADPQLRGILAPRHHSGHDFLFPACLPRPRPGLVVLRTQADRRRRISRPAGQASAANLLRSSAYNSFTQLDAILSARQTLTASFHFAPHSLQYAGLDYFNPQPVTPDANFHESTATLTHRWQIGDGLLQTTFS